MSDAEHTARVARYVRVAGICYLVIIIASLLSFGLIDGKITVAGDLSATLANIETYEELYRLGLAHDLLMFSAVILLAWALYMVLREVNPPLAFLGLLWRVAEGVVGTTAVLIGLCILLLAGASAPPELGTEAGRAMAMTLVGLREASYSVVIFSLCLGTVINCALFWTSRMIPRWLSGFGMVSFGAMGVIVVGGILAPDAFGPLFMVGGAPTILFELVFGGWLLLRGVRLPHAEIAPDRVRFAA